MAGQTLKKAAAFLKNRRKNFCYAGLWALTPTKPMAQINKVFCYFLFTKSSLPLRFIPRIMEAKPETLLNMAGDNLNPEALWNTMFKNEKPGGHGERSVAIGTMDMAIWPEVTNGPFFLHNGTNQEL
jgi:hypothetical protein